MLDSEVVAAIVAGEPDGLAEAYDRYASPLYTYCRSLLHEPADAADAVQDTFVIAASKLAGLRDQSRLRPWLYAVARNECHRRLRENARGATSALDLLPEMSDESADVTGGAERAELRALLRSAVRGLNTGEQDLIELQLRQELDVEEIAAVLGVSRNHAHALLSRARDQLEISLGALLVARSGRADCAALSALLEDWDGQLNVLMRKRINRHIERCPACTERKRRELAPALLLGLAPLAALPMAAMPHGLRAEVLRLASSDTPEAVAHRASVAQQAATFGPSGFPKPLDPPKPPWWRARRTQSVAAGAAVVAVTAVVAGLALSGGLAAHHGRSNALGPVPGGSSGALPTASSGASSGAAPSRPDQSARPTVSASGVSRVSPGPGAGGSPSPGPGGSPTPGAGGSPTPGPGGSSGPGGSPSPSAPSSSRSSSPGSPAPSTSTGTPTSKPSSPPPPPAAGTLSVSPTTILLSPLTGASLTLTASGGPVTWSITEPSSLIGKVRVSPSSGTLASGQSVTVTFSVSSLASVDSQLIVNPGGIAVTVVLGVGIG
jgi:RNA polymerase sigma factor (sigma-70 family)